MKKLILHIILAFGILHIYAENPVSYLTSNEVRINNKSIVSFIKTSVIPYLDSIRYTSELFYLICDIGTNSKGCRYCIINAIPKKLLTRIEFMSEWNLYYGNGVSFDNIGYCDINGYRIIVNGEDAHKYVIRQKEKSDSFRIQTHIRALDTDATWYLTINKGKVKLAKFSLHAIMQMISINHWMIIRNRDYRSGNLEWHHNSI